MPRKPPSARQAAPSSPRRPSSLLDTRIIYCGDCLDQLKKLPAACVDLIYIDPSAWPKPLHRGEGPPFNSNRNDEVFWGERSEPRAQASGFLPAFEDRHASTQAYIDYMRPRCVELARVLNKSGSLYYHCDWHASHYVKVMVGQQHPACGPARARDIFDRCQPGFADE